MSFLAPRRPSPLIPLPKVAQFSFVRFQNIRFVPRSRPRALLGTLRGVLLKPAEPSRPILALLRAALMIVLLIKVAFVV